MIDFKEKVVKGTLWFGLIKFSGQALSWIFTIILARLLAPSDFGLIAMTFLYLTFCQMLIEMGLGFAIIQNQKLSHKDLSCCFWIISMSAVGFYIITFLVSPVVASFFKAVKLTLILRVMGLCLILNAIRMIHLSLLSKEIKFKKRAIAELIGSVTTGLTSMICAMKGLEVWSLVYGHLIGNFAQTIYSFYCYRWKPLLYLSFTRIRKMIHFGGNWTFAALLWYFYSNLDQVIVGRFLGDKVLGFYRIAFTLARAPLEKIWMIMNQITFSTFAAIQNDTERLKKYFLKSTKFMTIITFPASLGLIIVASDFIISILKAKWMPILIPLQLLALSVPVVALELIIPNLVLARGKAVLNLKFNIIGVFLFPLAFLSGLPFGLNGICIAWLVAYPVLFSYKLYYALKELNLSLGAYLQSFKEPFIATLIMGLVVVAVRITFLEMLLPLTRLIISVGLGAVVYLIFMVFILQGESKKDLISMLDIFFKRKKELIVSQ